jgi:hypothetical protein
MFISSYFTPVRKFEVDTPTSKTEDEDDDEDDWGGTPPR